MSVFLRSHQGDIGQTVRKTGLNSQRADLKTGCLSNSE
ncbi:hypothetical protein AM1_3477 [Acaryochloris marina MBIC11017]|uniref:Uncharacterized protein n=1 Tax=Acaryochloris marina (strain MBIC 11017) TaxID=329726 RepID=B0C172_ACAM1|nr:hypothetical protein AM1_3477 [Acaryochloris marina MBIC11017]